MSNVELKRPILILCLLLSDVIGSMAQANECDSIEYEKVIVSGIRLRDHVGRMTSRLGKPDTIIVKVNAFEGTEYHDYVYDSSRFSVVDEKITGFHLHDASFIFDYSHPTKVGDRNAALRKCRSTLPHIACGLFIFDPFRIGCL